MEKIEAINIIRKMFIKEFSLYQDIDSDFHINRFLLNENYNIKSTKKLLTQYFEFRKKKDFKDLEKDIDLKKAQSIQKLLRQRLYCTDRHYNPVLISRPKPEFIHKLIYDLPRDQLENFFIGQLERYLHIVLPLCSKKRQKRVDGLIIIFDLDEVGMTTFLSSDFQNFLKVFLQISQKYYPKMVKKIYIINASYFFSAFWNIMKLFLDKDTQQNIEVSTDGNKDVLLKKIGKRNLPKQLGGRNELSLDEVQGFYQKEFIQSYKNKKLTLEDDSIEKKYY